MFNLRMGLVQVQRKSGRNSSQNRAPHDTGGGKSVKRRGLAPEARNQNELVIRGNVLNEREIVIEKPICFDASVFEQPLSLPGDSTIFPPFESLALAKLPGSRILL